MTLKRQRSLKIKFTPNLRALLPQANQHLKGTEFSDSVSGTMLDLMNHLDGLVKSLIVSHDAVTIDWEQSMTGRDPIEPIVDLLKTSRYSEAVLLMELLLSDEPDRTDFLYNLGMAYSDMGKLSRAIELLTKLLELEPQQTNGRVALGVALTRNNQVEKAVLELQTAVSQDPTNPWAQRNLGAALAKQERIEESIPHLRRATEMNPEDQAAWYGLGQSLELTEQMDNADEAYRKALDINEFGQIAELTRSARSRIAQKTFRSVTPTMERMDAVMYCLGALEKFADMSLSEVQKIGFEIAILGTKGFNVNDPSVRYTLRSLPGDYSGLHLLCLEFVAFKKFAPDQTIGFDLSSEYRSALSLYDVKKKGS